MGLALQHRVRPGHAALAAAGAALGRVFGSDPSADPTPPAEGDEETITDQQFDEIG